MRIFARQPLTYFLCLIYILLPPKYSKIFAMAVKKSDLYRSLWDGCDKLKGGMDASQYKDYVLTMLFIKYVSDKYAGKTHAEVAVPAGASFGDMLKLKGKSDIGDQINKKIIAPLEQKNNLSGMPDFNDDLKLGSGKEKTERLSELIDIFNRPELDMASNRAEDDDLLGDAYEYLMRHFATESGKSKGQFYTPAEVSRLIAQILLSFSKNAPLGKTTFYDPACGSGSLLLKMRAFAGRGSLYGQEKDASNAVLANMNMILHGVPTAEIKQGNTLASPKFLDPVELKTFDYVAANPPFSDKSWSTGVEKDNDPYGRFDMGTPPPKQGDYAYLLHIVASMKPRGKGACILPHGVLFRGNAEAGIRKNLIKRGYIRGIVGLPPNLFYGTTIPACIVLLDKENSGSRRGVFFVDASAGYVKDGNKNRLREMDIRRIADAVAGEKDIPQYARMVSTADIHRNDYNLNVPRYIDSIPPEDVHSIDGHLNGGVSVADIESPLLAPYWKEFTKLRGQLFEPLRDSFLNPMVESAQVSAIVVQDKQYQAFSKTMRDTFGQWRGAHNAYLRGLEKNCVPKNVIKKLGDSILSSYQKMPLLDHYAAYEVLMQLWGKNMSDDCYLIAANGWVAKPESLRDKKNKEIGWECDLVPKQLVKARYFAKEQKLLDDLQKQAAGLSAERMALEEEHSDDEGLLADMEKINKQNVKTRLKEIAQSSDTADFGKEEKVLNEWLNLKNKEAEIAQKIKRQNDELDKKTRAHYDSLTKDEIKELVINDKWFSALEQSIQELTDRIRDDFCERLRMLCERYKTKLSDLEKAAAGYERKVNKHLRQMGFSRA